MARQRGGGVPAIPWRTILFLGALGLIAVTGCARGGPGPHALYDERERAFKLIDQGRDLEQQNNPLLALERFNLSALNHETPAAWFEMGRQFENEGRDEQAATAYQRAIEMASDYQEARLALISLGFTPAGYQPTEADLKLAAELTRQRQERLAGRRAALAAQVGAQQEQQQADLAARRQSVLEEAALRRLPTQAEVESVIFSPQAHRGAPLPSALAPTYTVDTDIILGTYAHHLQKAEQLRARGQDRAAEDEYLAAIAADPGKIDARLDLGDMLLRQEQSERALYHYQRAMEDFPNSPRPFHKLGNYYLDHGRPEEARRHYRLALEKDPGFMEAYNNLAALDMREGKFEDARKVLDEVIRQNPTYANAYLNRGIIASEVDHDADKALDCYRRYVELNGPRAAEVRRWIRELQNQPN